MMHNSLKTGAAALGLNRPRTVKGAFNPSMVNTTNEKTTKPANESCCTSTTSFFSGLTSKCFFWMETPDPNALQATSSNPALSFEDRATSEDDSEDEESEKEEEKEEGNRASSLSGRNSHSTSIKIP